jgi:hypothetical protein
MLGKALASLLDAAQPDDPIAFDVALAGVGPSALAIARYARSVRAGSLGEVTASKPPAPGDGLTHPQPPRSWTKHRGTP